MFKQGAYSSTDRLQGKVVHQYLSMDQPLDYISFADHPTEIDDLGQEGTQSDRNAAY